jgi:hypothetical protein
MEVYFRWVASGKGFKGVSIISSKVIGDGISFDAYAKQTVERGHREFSMSRGEIMSFAENPKRWLDGYQDNEATDSKDWGQLIECMVGLSGRFDDLYAIAPAEYEDEKTGKMKPWNWNSNFCKAWRDEQGGREVIKAEHFGKAKDAVAALRKDPDVMELFSHSKNQVMVCGEWRDEPTGIVVPLRCLIDLLPTNSHPRFSKWLSDFKTTKNGNPDSWARVVDDFGYDIQAALSTDLYVAATKEDRVEWVHVVQENMKPYHVVTPLPALTVEFISYGREKYRAALRLYSQCLATGKWPSYSTGTRLVFGGVQYIGPDTLWKYRETGGAVQSRMDYEPPPT